MMPATMRTAGLASSAAFWAHSAAVDAMIFGTSSANEDAHPVRTAASAIAATAPSTTTSPATSGLLSLMRCPNATSVDATSPITPTTRCTVGMASSSRKSTNVDRCGASEANARWTTASPRCLRMFSWSLNSAAARAVSPDMMLPASRAWPARASIPAAPPSSSGISSAPDFPNNSWASCAFSNGLSTWDTASANTVNSSSGWTSASS